MNAANPSSGRRPPIRLAVFDLTGTLIQDSGLVGESFAMALRGSGVEPDAESLAEVRGASKREATRRLLERLGADSSDPRVEHVYSTFQANLIERLFHNPPDPIPGAGATLDTLRNRGIRVALNTGFERTVVNALLRVVGWGREGWSAIVCGDEVPRGRPAPYLIFRAMELSGVDSVHEVAVSGDTTADLEAGWRAGVALNFGVLTGAHSRERLAQAPHTAIIDSVAEVPALLDAYARG